MVDSSLLGQITMA